MIPIVFIWESKILAFSQHHLIQIGIVQPLLQEVTIIKLVLLFGVLEKDFVMTLQCLIIKKKLIHAMIFAHLAMLELMVQQKNIAANAITLCLVVNYVILMVLAVCIHMEIMLLIKQIALFCTVLKAFMYLILMNIYTPQINVELATFHAQLAMVLIKLVVLFVTVTGLYSLIILALVIMELKLMESVQDHVMTLVVCNVMLILPYVKYANQVLY